MTKAGNDASTERFFLSQLNVDIACSKFGNASNLFVLKSERNMRCVAYKERR